MIEYVHSFLRNFIANPLIVDTYITYLALHNENLKS